MADFIISINQIYKNTTRKNAGFMNHITPKFRHGGIVVRDIFVSLLRSTCLIPASKVLVSCVEPLSGIL